MSRFFNYLVVLSEGELSIYPKHWYQFGKLSVPKFNVEPKVKNQAMPDPSWLQLDVRIFFEVDKISIAIGYSICVTNFITIIFYPNFVLFTLFILQIATRQPLRRSRRRRTCRNLDAPTRPN